MKILLFFLFVSFSMAAQTYAPINAGATTIDKKQPTSFFNSKRDSAYFKTYEKLKLLYLEMV